MKKNAGGDWLTAYADVIMSQYGSATWHWVIWELPLSTGLKLWQSILRRLGSDEAVEPEHNQLLEAAKAAERAKEQWQGQN